MRLTILLSILLALSANAEIFTWTDIDGTIHFVDDKDKVPSKYPLTPFVFTQDKKWSVDQSDTKASNAFRLEQLRADDDVVKPAPPAPVVIIEQNFGRVKRHRSHRHGR